MIANTITRAECHLRLLAPLTVLPPAALAIAELTPFGCRWPLGEVAAEEFRFCNAPRRRGSYCERHRGLARRGARA